ncbi:MAG: class I SAM-dependent methyltransferase [Phycisphaeraceae bacterium]|nr:class I SAM-dependent methyltransferase [Phycisphaeraceae bacterium]
MLSGKVAEVVAKVDALRGQVDDHWQIPADEALVLMQIVLIGGFKSICEVGHSYGFSTLHLAAAAQRNGGHVYSFDLSEKKHDAAGAHLAEAGLADRVTFTVGDARKTLEQVEPEAPYDFVFIDAVKQQSDAYLDVLLPRLAPRVAIALDNTRTHRRELGAFVQRIRALEGFVGCDVEIGNGFELAFRMG